MIKFWKSAAKGKSGCPVRPPEQRSLCSLDIKTLVENQSNDEIEGNPSKLFLKKSKISLTLHDIIINKVALNYLTHFMETIGKDVLIKAWIELEWFKTLFTRDSNCIIKDNPKINRAKSFDLQNHNKNKNEALDCSQINTCTSDLNSKCEYSTSSCDNLSEHHNLKENSTNWVIGKDSIITEKAINLFKKYVALEATNKLDLPDDTRKLVISNICQPEGHITLNCFQPVQDILYSQIEQKHFEDFQRSPFYIKAQIDILTTETLGLKDILYNEAILFYFTEYLEQETCRILLEFLIAVTHFRDSFNSDKVITTEQAQSDAMILYDKYFSLQATSPIGFPTDVRLKIESEICREGGTLQTCFDVPYLIIFKTLSCYVKTFLDSEVYYKYLSEMIHTVDQPAINHKSNSDCSSEYSISTQNTLLAMGDPVFSKRKRNHSVPDMTIDSNQLYNADALWQRKRQEGLILGRVNSLGRFESKFEPDPDKKQRSVIKKMVSRFTPTSPSKVEEEMAWQIAHMIVKDITDLTMAPPENDHSDL